MRIHSFLSSNNERTESVKKNILGSLFIKGVSILVSLLIVPLTIGYVSSEIYGIWLTLSSILYWLTYMDVGFTLGLKNRLAEAIALNDLERGKKLVSTTYLMMVVIFAPLATVAFFVCPFVDWCNILNINTEYQTDVIRTIQLLAIFMALQMIVNVFVAVVAAFQKIALSSLFAVIGQISAFIVIYVMTETVSPSLSNLTFAYSLMPVLVIAIASFMFYHGAFRK